MTRNIDYSLIFVLTNTNINFNGGTPLSEFDVILTLFNIPNMHLRKGLMLRYDAIKVGLIRKVFID